MARKSSPAGKTKTPPPAKHGTAPVAPPKSKAAAKAAINKTTTASGGGPIGKRGATSRHARLPRHSPRTARGN